MVPELNESVHVKHLKPCLIVLYSKCSIIVHYNHCSCYYVSWFLPSLEGSLPPEAWAELALTGCWHSASLEALAPVTSSCPLSGPQFPTCEEG